MWAERRNITPSRDVLYTEKAFIPKYIHIPHEIHSREKSFVLKLVNNFLIITETSELFPILAGTIDFKLV